MDNLTHAIRPKRFEVMLCITFITNAYMPVKLPRSHKTYIAYLKASIRHPPKTEVEKVGSFAIVFEKQLTLIGSVSSRRSQWYDGKKDQAFIMLSHEVMYFV
jgi:hypothetical protein